MTVVIDLKNAGAYIGALPDHHRNLAISALRIAAAHCVQTIQSVIIPSRNPQPVDRGIYRAGWKVDSIPEGAVFYNDSPIAAIVEHGVRGSNVKIGRKMLAALAEWVVRKGMVKKIAGGVQNTAQTNAAMSIAWAIAKAAAAGRGFHNRYSDGGQQIMSECNVRFTNEYVRDEIQRAIGGDQ